ncbi:ribonuclease H-like domain-containing protein [Aspergillus egyptiacus]|nr:ribonuclease H-like domain-containing protein [Aspergillus egyptiacus]
MPRPSKALTTTTKTPSVERSAEERAAAHRAAERALAAREGHPNALRSGGWATVEEIDYDTFLHLLTTACHDPTSLARKNYPGRSEWDPEELTSTLPIPDDNTPKRKAVVLDCEMICVATAEGGQIDNTLAQLCAVDVLTGEPLLDILVRPGSGVIVDYVTAKSGLTEDSFTEYDKHGITVTGAEQARGELFKLVDRNTILVGHALENDLKALGIYHDKIIDTQILVSEAVSRLGVFCRSFGLKQIAEELLGRWVQNAGDEGHDCLEDCYAPREIVIWMLQGHTARWVEEWAREKIETGENLRKKRSVEFEDKAVEHVPSPVLQFFL